MDESLDLRYRSDFRSERMMSVRADDVIVKIDETDVFRSCE